MRSGEDEVPPEERAKSRERARTAYRWALRYAVAGSRPLVVAVMGRVGTGKSTQAEALADALGWPAVSSDRVRKERAGVPLHERGDAAARQQLYAQDMTETTYEALLDTAVERAREGQGTVLDATFSRRCHRDALRERLASTGVPYVFVELVADDATLKRRLAARENADAVISDARLEDFAMLVRRYEAPDALEDARHIQVRSDEDPAVTTREALQHLVRLKPEPTAALPTLDGD